MIHVVLYNPEIPQNTGNIMRSCIATNTMLHLIEPLGFDLDEKKLNRFGAGYVEHAKYKVYKNWDEFTSLEKPKKLVFTTRYGHKTPREFDFKFNGSVDDDDIYLVFGSESSGIPKDILKNNIDRCVRLPMNHLVRSLNLSNVVCVMIYEVLAQNSYFDLYHDEPDSLKGKNFLEELEVK